MNLSALSRFIFWRIRSCNIRPANIAFTITGITSSGTTKYRFKVFQGQLRLRIRDICRQVCAQNGVEIIRDVLSSDHVHMFVSVPPKLAISDLVRLMKGKSSHKIQREFPQVKQRYWGHHFLSRGYFSTTKGTITEDIVLQYLD